VTDLLISERRDADEFFVHSRPRARLKELAVIGVLSIGTMVGVAKAEGFKVNIGAAPGQAAIVNSPDSFLSQAGITFKGRQNSIVATVRAVRQNIHSGVVAESLNGLDNRGDWWQILVIYQANAGFRLGVEGFRAIDGKVYQIYPPYRGAYETLVTERPAIMPGDRIRLSENFIDGKLLVLASDLNRQRIFGIEMKTSATFFVGFDSIGSKHGFFTGVMTEAQLQNRAALNNLSAIEYNVGERAASYVWVHSATIVNQVSVVGGIRTTGKVSDGSGTASQGVVSVSYADGRFITRVRETGFKVAARHG
jgi:hypothetical protein